MVRKLLAENGISETEVTGTGSGGRITRDDAQRVVEARRAAPPPAPPAAAPAATGRRHPSRPRPAAPVARAPQAPSVSMASFRAAGDQIVPFSNMRRRTAEHMVRSKATSPHAFIANEVDFESVERVRKAWGERFKAEEGFALTYLPFVARAAVEALRDFPLAQRVGGRRLAARARRGEPRHRGRPVPRGPDRARSSTGPKRSRCAAWPGASATWPSGHGAASSTRTTSPAGRSPSRTTVRSVPTSPCRSSTSPRWRFWPPTASPAGRWW